MREDGSRYLKEIAAAGLEHNTKPSEKRIPEEQGGADSGALDGERRAPYEVEACGVILTTKIMSF
jgi:hypothetical protein